MKDKDIKENFLLTATAKKVIDSQIKILEDLKEIFVRAVPDANGSASERSTLAMEVPVLSGRRGAPVNSEYPGPADATKMQVHYVVRALDAMITKRRTIGTKCTQFLKTMRERQISVRRLLSSLVR